MAPSRRVIVVGLDGLEPTIVDALIESGDLPNLARLRDAGGYSRMATTTPAQTPVAWSTFATGVNPGGHGIFDFLRRDPATYLPDLALTRYEQRSAFLMPRAVNLRRGRTVWEALSDAGISSTVLRCPCTFPPDESRGRMLSGMGVPDIRGGLGTSTFYSNAPDLAPRESEQVVALVRDGPAFTGRFIGPRNPRSRTDVTIPFRLEADPVAGTGTLTTEVTPGAVRLEVGKWSDWVSLRFRVGLLTSVRGIVRLLLVRLTPHVELYASPVNFDPESPMFPISRPPEYAAELAAISGPFHTAGIAEDHTGLSNGRLDEDDFLAQCDLVMREREAMLRHELDRQREGLLFCLFDTPDRIQHMFWRFRDPSHPANKDQPHRPEWDRAIEDHYRRCDAMVGEVMRSVDDRTLLIVASDHGFSSFHRGVGLNAWLHRHGYLVLRDGAAPGPEAGEFFGEVDWGRTRAYALGFGGIYLNLKGREAAGVVDPGVAASLAEELAERLTGLVDPERGATAVLAAKTRASIYRGPFANESPDLVVEFCRGYRASWTTALGGIPATLFEDNTRKWAGDHIVAPELVPGVLFMNREFSGADARMVDLAPTILRFLGTPVPAEYEGRSLLNPAAAATV